MGSKQLIDPAIEEFYSGGSEEARLQLGLGPLELERNKELIGRFLPEGGGAIADVGGGPGVYAAWLANLGHEVTLIDPVTRHVAAARNKAAKMRRPFRALEAEARNLPLADRSMDLVVLHGPLYHLQERADRLKALLEARRVLKPQGVVLAFAINHSASTVVGLLNGMIHQPGFRDMCLAELQTGLHEPLGNTPGMLPKAFFHRPEELKAELEEAGFSAPALFAVEGMIWLDSKYFETRGDQQKKEAMFGLLRATETNEALLAWSPHMMGVGRTS
ncbi:SAM-dependent methyltransferase [Pedobacter yulinensis]|uniref:SAM-dependent methyltransferase n=1 Tax=Pedobacter yulinensis TaxID=2126353 RepID=A0A2T3HLU6_9SPHI|nr:class I SAM-dependent methyltransferase [Pedobacter yulinensis]PST83438.1 SAM-dependent methyltransferase [Pedobacter yulinensis]